MTKLLFVIGNLNIGGPQKSLLALLDRIDYSRFSVDVLSLTRGGQLKKYFNKNVHFLDGSDLLYAMMLPVDDVCNSLLTFVKYKRIGLLFESIYRIIKFLVIKGTIMNQERQKIWKRHHKALPDLSSQYDAAFGILGLSTYYIVDNVKAKKKYHWVRSDVRILQLNKNIEEFYFRKVDGILSVSNECSKIFMNEYPFSKGNVYTFYNYIPESFYKSIECDTNIIERSKGIKILTISRLMPMKGIEYVIDVCAELVKRKKEFCWFVLGDGKMRESYQAIIDAKGIRQNLILLGFQLNTLEFLNRCDLFVHLSESEGKSNAVDEAKFAGKPIVITNYPTVHEQIINNKTGLICSFDKEEIADSICKLIDDSNLRQYLSRNCLVEENNGIDANEFISELIKSDASIRQSETINIIE